MTKRRSNRADVIAMFASILLVLGIFTFSPAAAQNLDLHEDKADPTTVSSAQAPVSLTVTTPTFDATASPTTFIKTYANFISKTTQQKDVTPNDVQATSDGGYIMLATTDCTNQPCVRAQGNTNNLESWLVKTDSSANPQWQKEVGSFGIPPGDYSIGISVQQAKDGGYIIGGGAIPVEGCSHCLARLSKNLIPTAISSGRRPIR